MMTLIAALVGVIFGGVITLFVAKRYYIRATKDLKKETSQLRKLNTLMLRGMESAGWVKYNRDKDGNPIGLIFEESSEIKIKKQL